MQKRKVEGAAHEFNEVKLQNFIFFQKNVGQ